MSILEEILNLPEFVNYTQYAQNDWRDTSIENPAFSISSVGWCDHRNNKSGRLEDLIPEIDIEGIYAGSKMEPLTIMRYFKTRNIKITTKTINELGIKVNTYLGIKKLLVPLKNKQGSLVHLLSIKLNERFEKSEKKKLFGKNRTGQDRCIILNKTLKDDKYLIVEGLENGLVLLEEFGDHTIIVSCGANQLLKAKSFIKRRANVVVKIIMDNDDNRIGEKSTVGFGESVERFMHPTKQDANDALLGGNLKNWCKELRQVSYEEILELTKEDKNAEESGVIESLNKKHAIISIGGKVTILNDEYDPILKRWGISFSSKADLELKYLASKIYTKDDKGKIKSKNYAQAWLNSKNRRQYDGLCFDPENITDDDKYFNIWRGFAFEPKDGNCSLYYDHLFNNITNKNQKCYDYILDWMAHTVQNLASKSEVSIILRGKPGTGKGVCINWFKSLFGQHGVYVKTMDHLVGKFNAHVKDCILLFADEIFVTGNKEHEGTLKGMVSESVHMIEHKGKDAFPFPNYLRLMMSSNHDYVIHLDSDDRRFFILDVGDGRALDKPYFDEMTRQMKEEQGQNKLLLDLLERNIDRVNIQNYPSTKAIIDNKITSLNSIQAWVYNMLSTGDFPDNIPISKLYHNYKNSCGKVAESQNCWARELNKLLPSITRRQVFGKPGRYYFFNNLDDPKRDFEHSTGLRIQQ